MRIQFLFFVFTLVITACQSEVKKPLKNDNVVVKLDNKIKYAKGFDIEQFETYKIITLNNSWVGSETSYKYVLYNNEKPKEIEADVFIKTPIKTIACMSLTHIAFIQELKLEKSVVAISGCNYVSNLKTKKELKVGK